MITGLGIDLIEIDRIKEAIERNEKFVSRILTPDELELYNGYSSNRANEFVAGRFAAKEAFSKAKGTGIGKLRFTDIEILPDENGKPVLKSDSLESNEDAFISITHSKQTAMAQVIIQELIDREFRD